MRFSSNGQTVDLNVCVQAETGRSAARPLTSRQIVGVHHWVSPKHLPKYLDEMVWRCNRRDMPTGDKANEGRLTYRALIA